MQTANKNKFGRFEAESMIELGKYWLMKGQADMALVYFSRVEDHIYLAVDFVTKRELFLYTVAAKVSQFKNDPVVSNYYGIDLEDLRSELNALIKILKPRGQTFILNRAISLLCCIQSLLKESPSSIRETMRQISI